LLELDGKRTITKLVYLPRQDWSENDHILNPGRFKKWELKYTPSNFWTEKTALEALRWTIEEKEKEKEKLTNEELLRVYDMEWMKQHRITMPVYEYWSNNPFLMYATRIVSRTFS